MGGGRRIGMGCSPPVPSLVELQTPSFVPLYRGGGRGRGGLDTHPVAGTRRVGPIQQMVAIDKLWKNLSRASHLVSRSALVTWRCEESSCRRRRRWKKEEEEEEVRV